MHLQIVYVLHNTWEGNWLLNLLIDKHLDFDVMSTRDLHFIKLFFSMNLYLGFSLFFNKTDFGKSQPNCGRDIERTPYGEVAKSSDTGRGHVWTWCLPFVFC